MKASKLLCISAVLFLGVATTFGVSAQPGVVRIDYLHPEKFTDFRIQDRDYRWSAPVFANEVTKALEPAMKRSFPGDKLRLRFTNIDLAGRYETPRRGGRAVRVNRGNMPARLSFDFSLQDSSGRTLRGGSERLVDNSRPSSFDPNRSDPLYSETRMLKRWFRSLSRS
jgi:DUF3016 family protein